MDYKESPILITGCARSGTSLTAGCIHQAGAWGGDFVGETVHNPKGFFENRAIRETIEKPFLDSVGCDKMGQNPLPTDNLLASFKQDQADELKKQLFGVLHREGYQGGQWFYKGAKMGLYWPLWNMAFPNARWILVRRKSSDIVNACLRTVFMRAYNSNRGWFYWISIHKRRFLDMFENDLNIHVVWPQRMIDGDLRQIKTAIEYMGLEYNVDKINELIEPKFWHSS